MLKMEWVAIALFAVVTPALAFGLLNFVDSQVDLGAPIGLGEQKASGMYIVTGAFIWGVLSLLIVAYYANAKAATSEIQAREFIPAFRYIIGSRNA